MKHLAAAATAALVLLASSGAASARSVVDVIYSVFGHGRAGHNAVCVARAESELKPTAVSPTGDYGVFQANYLAHHWPGESVRAFAARMFNVETNVRFAYRLSAGGRSWGAWAPRTRSLCGL